MPFDERFGGRDFYGFAAMVGISYPYGKNIVQDPTISSQAVTDLAMAGEPSNNGNGENSSPVKLLPIGLILIASIAIIGVVLATVLIRRRQPKQPKQNYEMPNQPHSDWGKYYEKK